MQSLFRYSVAFIIAVAFFSGCAYAPGPNTSGPGKTIPPKAGSTYTFKNVQTDTTGKVIDSTAYFSRDSIAEVGTTYDGKTNVSHIISIDLASGYPIGDSYINYETDGDISVFTGGSGGFGGVTLPDWQLYATQTHTVLGFKSADTSVTLPGIPVPVHFVIFDTTSFVSNGTYTSGTNNIPVFNLKQVLSENASAILLSISTNTTQHLAFAPSLGYFVSTIQDPTKIPAVLPSQGGSQSTLTGYVLK